MYDAKVWYKVSCVRFDFVSYSMNFIFSIYFIFHFCFNKIFLGALYQSLFPCKMYRGFKPHVKHNNFFIKI